jgi:hypothetical protein
MQLRHDTDESLPSSAKVKNKWSYTSTPPVFYGVEKENCTFSTFLGLLHLESNTPFKHYSLYKNIRKYTTRCSTVEDQHSVIITVLKWCKTDFLLD